MTGGPEINGEPDFDEHGLAERLQAERPVPAAGFRGALSRHLAAWDPGHGPRPARLWALAGGYLGAGALLLGIGALQATGVL